MPSRVSALRCALVAVCLLLAASVHVSAYRAALAQHQYAAPPGGLGPAAAKEWNLMAYASIAAASSLAFPKPDVLLFAEFGLVGSESLGSRATTVAYAERVPDCPAPNCSHLQINPSEDPDKFAERSARA